MTTPIVQSLSEIASGYDALYCDLWGCFHNGLRAYPDAVTALRAFRAQGGTVLLMTNAPRSAPEVRLQLDRMGAPGDCWDAIVSSGDAARAELSAGRFGERVLYVGPQRDLSFFDGVAATLTGAAEAESVICVGLRDDSVETPEDYAPEIADWAARGLPMLCANPDIIVDRGDQRLWCAGALARDYAAAGGRVVYSGKPHRPIYDLGAATLARLRGPGAWRVLAVGDGIFTDIEGAVATGIDSLFVTGGIAAEEISGDPEAPDPARLATFLAGKPQPTYAIGRLR